MGHLSWSFIQHPGIITLAGKQNKIRTLSLSFLYVFTNTVQMIYHEILPLLLLYNTYTTNYKRTRNWMTADSTVADSTVARVSCRAGGGEE